MILKFRHLSLWAIALSLAFISPRTFGQITSATVTGSIVDAGRAALPGAAVNITNVNTSVVSTASTNDGGLYRIAGLIPGIYQISVSRDGFKSVLKYGMELHLEDEVGINFELQVGSISESVTVQVGEPLVNTETTSLGEVIEGRQVEDTPPNRRNAMNLVALVPGVVPQGTTTDRMVSGTKADWTLPFVPKASIALT